MHGGRNKFGGWTGASAPTQSKEMRTSTDGRGRTPPLRKRYKECDFYRAGRCGERTERCRWQRKRSERVAAVKILSVRRKAAQKFWAPQQDHRPLRRVARSACVESPSHGFACPAPFRQGGLWGRGMRIATTSVRAGFAMTYYTKCGGRWHTWVPPYKVFVGQGLRALP